MSSSGQFHLSRSIKWQLWAHGRMKPFTKKMILILPKKKNPSKQKTKKEKNTTKPTLLCVCVCVLFLLHPEQSAAVHKASCYPRDRWHYDSLKACASSVRHAALLKINLNASFLVLYRIFLLKRNKRAQGSSVSSLRRPYNYLYLTRDLISSSSDIHTCFFQEK